MCAPAMARAPGFGQRRTAHARAHVDDGARRTAATGRERRGAAPRAASGPCCARFVWQSRQGLASAAATVGPGVTTALAARPLCTRNARSCGQPCGSGRSVGRRAVSSSDSASSGACQASGSRSQRRSAMKPDICACTIQRCARSSAACASTEEPAQLLSATSQEGEGRAIRTARVASSARGTCTGVASGHVRASTIMSGEWRVVSGYCNPTVRAWLNAVAGLPPELLPAGLTTRPALPNGRTRPLGDPRARDGPRSTTDERPQAASQKLHPAAQPPEY